MRTLVAAFLLAQSFVVSAQEISFFHLNTADGLSDNLVTAAVRDKNGLLWIGTAEGLNTFDGFTVKKFYKEEYPALGSNHIADLLCDEENRIWVRSNNGKVTLVDEKRNFTAVPVMDEGKETVVSYLCRTRSRGIITMYREKIFVLKKTEHYFFESSGFKNDFVFTRSNHQQANENSDTFLFTGNSRITLYDMSRLQVLYTIPLPLVISAAMLNDREILASTEKNMELFRIDLASGRQIKNYGSLNDQYGEPVNSYLRHIRKIKNGKYIISSGYGGVYSFDPVMETINRHQHDALDNSSVSANNTFYVYAESSGYVFVTTRSAGLNYFNSEFKPAGYRSAFQETSGGAIFHGFINYITQHRNGHFWLGTQSGLIEWDREKNKTIFHDYGEINGIPLNGKEEVRVICFDKNDNAWLGLNRYGIVVLDKKRNVIKYLDADSTRSSNHLPGNFIHNIIEAPDKKLWLCTAGGLCVIDPDSYVLEKKEDHPLLKMLDTVSTYTTWFRNTDEVWAGTNRGAYRYRLSTGEVSVFDHEHGLSNNNVICFADDKAGNVYIGTSNGLNIVNGNKIVKVYNRDNGLRSDRCFGLITDADNNIWIGNDNAMLCYTPEDSSFRLYDDSYGLSPSGFRLLSYYQTKDHEQLWGSDLGLSYFFPADMEKIKNNLQVRINTFSAGNKGYSFSGNEKIKIPYSDNNLLFGFSAIDLYSSKNLIYEYMLEGADNDWVRTSTAQLVTYSNLAPGDYTFKVRVSKEGRIWEEASNPVILTIRTPWFRSRLFIALCITGFITAIWYFIHNRNRKIQIQKEQLETEKGINYFASSIYEQKTADDILWDVTKNCISRLHFEDCVIYMIDEEKNVLLQKAAWGPKTNEENKILNPLEIPAGKGIVGSVAVSGIAEIIPDTSKDDRYIVDDTRRYSEIAVPIIYNGKVIGVIDSEHPKKNFFTTRHLSILNTIASLCANKIIRSRAEEAKQKAQMELLDHQRKMAEAQLKSLRLQMSPHFLFNALNSIQQIILSGNDASATKYLSRFSRLLRLVLHHSDREKISLKEEIETLGLYLELESLRFDDSFVYEIKVDTTLDVDEIKIPTLLIQPFVENAIWHGLLHKEGIRKLSVRFSEDEQDNLLCIVEDNGIGRDASGKTNNKETHTGKGLSVAEERVKTFNEQHSRKSFFIIEDVKDERGSATGTRVRISLPLIK